MEMQWSKSETIGKLIEALAKAKLKFDPVLKDTTNPAFHSKYADLASVIGATQDAMASEGLVMIQMPHAEFGPEDAKLLTLTSLLAHSSGEFLTSDLTLPAMMRERFDAQSVGSAITYARRYAWTAMTGVAQEDDDGNKAAGMGTKEAAQSVAASKLKTAAKGDESVLIVAYKECQLALTGNGLSIVRASLTEGEKTQLDVKYDKDSKGYVIREAEGNFFASLCEKYKVPVKWAAEA